MVALSVVIDTSGLDAASDQLRRVLPAHNVVAAVDIAAGVAATARVLCPSRSGQLRESIQVGDASGDEDGAVCEVVATAPHARPVEEGTKPHIIRAHGKALRFEVGGDVIFRKAVRHPGMQGRFYMKRAAEIEQPEAARIVAREVEEAIREAGLG